MKIDKESYPHLFQERVWPFGPTRAVFELGTEPPPELIGQVTMVPYIGDKWLLLRHRDGYWFPGGHLEPGETYVQTIHREMREEAGARLVSFVMSHERLIGGRFQIADLERDLLGRGGMGDVYRGTDLQTSQTVAIKALRPEVMGLLYWWHARLYSIQPPRATRHFETIEKGQHAVAGPLG